MLQLIAVSYKTHFSVAKERKIFVLTLYVCAFMICVFSLHPGDLYPFTRKPLFVIIDSDNSSAFEVCWVGV